MKASGKVLQLTFVTLVTLAQSTSLQAQSENFASSLTLPPAPVKPVMDDYYGAKITDPYRYLEDLKNPEVLAWMRAQNEYTRAMLARIPGRAQLLSRITQLDRSVPQVDAMRLPGDRYLIRKRLPSEDIAKIYLREGLNGEDKLVIDPDKIKISAANAKKGRNSIQYSSLSLDGRYLAVGVAPGGSEHDTEIHLIQTITGEETGDVILRSPYPDPSWLPDNRSFIYGKLQDLPPGAPVTEIEQKYRAYLHVLGTNPKEDKPVFGYGVVPAIDVDPRYFAGVTVPRNSAYAIGLINSGVSPNSAFYIEPAASLGKTNSAWRKVADFDDDVQDVALEGDDLYLLTYKNAARYKILRTSARNPDLASAEIVVPPGQAVVTGMHPAEDALYVEVLDGGIGRVLQLPKGPHPRVTDIALPIKGSAYVATDPRVSGALLYLTGWAKAFRIYAYDPQIKRVTDTKLQATGPYDDPAGIESAEVMVRSSDGTQVPLSIVYPKGLKFDGSNPTLLNGYGAYGISSTAYFQPIRLAWHEKGGVFAVCHVRGGGEYGEEWHLAGKGSTKPNTWRDFIACAEYLVDKKYTSPSHLAGEGGSAGGILIGRAITERPDLFGAAVDIVGCSDMLRQETTANGVPNIPEFGSTKTEAGFKQLFAMSAYHHVADRTPYPAVLLETGMNDPRVDPWQMGKMTARLQAATSSGKPILLRIEYEGGHGGMGGTEKQLQERTADTWSFLLWQFGAGEFQPKP